MDTSRIRWTLAVAASASLLASSCTGALTDEAAVSAARASVDDTAEPIPAPTDETTGRAVSNTQPPGDPLTAAMIDKDRRLALVGGDVPSDTWFKFDAFPSPDRSTAVMTLGPRIEGIGPERPIIWVGLPDGEQRGEQVMRTDSELTATSLDGTFAGFTSRAAEPIDGAIAGARRTSLIQIVSRDDGVVLEQELEGNFMPEAFSGRLTADGVPAMIFLLEYFPADVPRFYRVRVLSTETGDVSLPLNLRNKAEQVDERMAGFSRSQIVAEDHGLLFTLYRGTLDGTPDGEPYAFVHTLDFADGVWCLEVDRRLELDRVPGSLAVGGDRLYVASANGMIGSYPIPSISDSNLSPSMDWVADTGAPMRSAPVATADHEAVYVVDESRPGFVNRVGPSGDLLPPTLFDGTADAFAWNDGALHAVGEEWATFDIIDRPDWLGDIAHLVVD